MLLNDLLDAARTIAPESLAEPWDKVGLHVGDPGATVRSAMLCIDLTPDVANEAITRKVQLVIAYHPPIFEPLKMVVTTEPRGAVIHRLIRAGVAVYSPHTALDAAVGGVNDWLAAGLGPGRGRPIKPTEPTAQGHVKLVTFVPADHAEAVRDAMSDAGAGCIGNYDSCSFSHPGEGAFRGGRDTKPFIGTPGKLERVAEVRLEMICRRSVLPAALRAMRESHPYEEPAFDLIPLEPAPPVDDAHLTGQGRIWTLDEPIPLATLQNRVRRRLGVTTLELAVPVRWSRMKITTVAVCAGAGASLLVGCEADVYLTGEMRHHDLMAATQRGRIVILAGHTQTERPYLLEYRRRLQGATKGGVEWHISKKDRAPSVRL